VKQAFFAYVNHYGIHSWNQSVLSNEGKVSCSRKQREPLMGARTHDWQATTDHESDALRVMFDGTFSTITGTRSMFCNYRFHPQTHVLTLLDGRLTNGYVQNCLTRLLK